MSRPQESSMHKPIVTEPRRVDAEDSESDYSDSEDDRAGTFASAAANEELDEWSEGGEDDAEADEPSTCLFCSNRSATLVDLRSHMQSAHSFDFRAVSQRLQLDFYAQMKLINYIREKISNKETDKGLVERLNAANASSNAELRFLYDGSESYLKPFLNDDSLLFSLPKNFQNKAGSKEEDDEEEEQPEDNNAAAAAGGQEEQKSDANPSSSSSAPSVTSLLQENQSLRNELESMAEAMRTMQTTLKRVAFTEEENNSDAPPALTTAASSSSTAASSSVAPAAVAAAKPAKASSSANPGSFAPEHIDRDYFGGYSTRNIHELMLRDTIRTEAYRDFMYKSGELFKGKVVLDVGCGTGILSMFAAKMGAKKVIGVDAADIVHKAREIISTNGFSNVIEIVHGKMEEVTLPVDKVDIIISEWMGYFLLFESMLPSVLYARDRYLRATPSASQSPAEATGVYPDKAIMYIGGIETSEAVKHRVDWWSDVYGFNMSCLVEEREKFQSSTVEIVRPHQVISDLVLLKEFDCNFVVDAALDFESDFVITFNEKSAQKPFAAFMVYFDTLFALHCKTVINLSTAPMKDHSPQPELTTHWMQSVFYLAKPLNVKQGDSIKGKLKAKRMKVNCRAYDVVIEYTHVQDGKDGASQVQEYKVQ